ncbi:MAG: metallophosphoesterase family protein [Bacillota bacterium]
MRLLFLTDTHFRGSSPVNRKDNLMSTLKEKLSEVVSLANDYRVDYVLHGGDFFDTPNPALSVVGDFLEILRELKAPLYGVAGNHDIFGGNLQTLSRTVLGFTARMGFFRLLGAEERVTLEAGGIRACLNGRPYHLDIDRRPRHLDYWVEKDAECDLTIHLIHGMLLDKQHFPGDCTLIDDLENTGADLVLAGHYHLGFGNLQRGNRHYVNPGALVRLSNHHREIERQVRVALIDLSGGAINCRLIPLQSAPAGEEVLDRTRAEELESRILAMERFTREVREATELKRWDVGQIINELARAENLSEEIRQEALRRIANAEESLLGREG